jgi:hypothetical protein
MANKRMFTMNIVDSDAFLEMPLSTQCLYFHLNMRADDDGFIGNAKRIMKLVGASDDDLKILIAKSFVLTFEDGVIVIKHWRMHNTLTKSRYHETPYLEDKSLLRLKKNGSYSFSNGKPLDDGKIVEMFNKGNKRRTNGEQAENVEEIYYTSLSSSFLNNNINSNEVNTINTSINFNAEKAFDDTFSIYPKKDNYASARLAWMDLLIPVIDSNRKEVAIELAYGLKMYLADYQKKNPDDEDYRYIPKFDKWIKENADYWIGQYEKSRKDNGS